MNSPATRRTMVVALALAFVVQTGLVYTDDTADNLPSLSEEAQEGWWLWHHHNCQSCHQFFGYGGFLGPDLTNAADRLTDERLQSILTEGAQPMPAFHLSDDEIESLRVFLEEMNEMGVSQPLLASESGADLLDVVLEKLTVAEALSPLESRGRALILEKRCGDCHGPAPGGRPEVTSLTEILKSPGEDGVRLIIDEGRTARGMPRFQFVGEDADAIIAISKFLAVNSEAIEETTRQRSSAQPTDEIPWFEYKRAR